MYNGDLSFAVTQSNSPLKKPDSFQLATYLSSRIFCCDAIVKINLKHRDMPMPGLAGALVELVVIGNKFTLLL